jgi:hypothetical protein
VGPSAWYAAGVTCIAFVACSSLATPDERPQTDFYLLGSLENLLKFPTTQEMLNECVKRNDATCVDLHSEFSQAVVGLFDKGSEAALKRTLDAVGTECRAPASGDRVTVSRWQGCRGAVAAFYFFPSDAEDRAILMHLATLDPEVLRTAFVESDGYTGDWVYNRPDRQRWIAFVEARPILRDQGMIAVFANPPKPHTGIDLLDPRSRANRDKAQEPR